MHDIAAEKAAVRRSILAQRDALPPPVRATRSTRITRYLLDRPELASVQAVLGYLSFGSEYDTQLLIGTLLARGKHLLLPRVDRATRRLQLFRVADPQAQTAAGTWGIREPVPERCIPAGREEADLVLVPGVAFTARGDRLGYGGGFYDRLLADWPNHPLFVAATFSLQVVETLPTEPDDVCVDAVVTEHGVVKPMG